MNIKKGDVLVTKCDCQYIMRDSPCGIKGSPDRFPKGKLLTAAGDSFKTTRGICVVPLIDRFNNPFWIEVKYVTKK